MNLEILKKYGLPTAFAAAAFAAFLWLVRSNQTDLRADVAACTAKIEKLREDINFLSTTVDLSCQPPKDVRRRPTPSPPDR